LTKDLKPRIIAQASPSIHISVLASEQCPDLFKTIPMPISTETDKPKSISDQLLNTDIKGYTTAKSLSMSSIPGGFPNDNTPSNNYSQHSNAPTIRQRTQESCPPKRYADESTHLVEATPTVEQALSESKLINGALQCKLSLINLINMAYTKFKTNYYKERRL
jgi:hypothetical protein